MRFLALLLFSTSAFANGWVFSNPDIHIVASYDACEYEGLRQKGLQYKVEIGVPITNLEDVRDAYSVNDTWAITTKGCWSEDSHQLYVYRKGDPDGYFDDNFIIEKSWTKQQ